MITSSVGTRNGQAIGRVAIFETNVFGAIAYHARCINCGWETRRTDAEATAVRAAKAHGAECEALREAK